MQPSQYMITQPTDGVWTELASDQHLQLQLDALKPQITDVAAVPTMAVKANIGVAGLARSAGSKVLEADRPVVDAPVVAALKTAGYVVAGTTNMHELAFGISSENADYGPVRLPGHPTRSAGGSSGGSSVAVAEGSVDIALGTDTGGSVSIPASHCGIYGLRPSTGRWPGAGVTGLSWTRDTAGVFARNLAQLQVVDAIITGQSAAKHSAERLRLGVPTQLLEALDPHTEQVVNLALEKLEQHAVLVEVDYAPILEQLTDAEQPVVLWESRRLLASVAAQTFDMAPQAGFEHLAKHVGSPDVSSLLHAELANPVSPDSYASAQRSIMQARSGYDQLLAKHKLDALVFPTTPAPAPLLGSEGLVEHLGEPAPIFPLYTRNTAQGTMLGAPMLTLPLPVPSHELPVGVTLQGARFEDRQLLTIAAKVDAACSA
ncbi:MAG: hypothetical protein L0L17_10850 [Yaniella sp.]|nr:hypothetical protein [Yaniella sp.]